MRTAKYLVIIGLVAVVAVFLAAPSAMAKKKLADSELDLITAAGEPKIVQTGTGSITFTEGPNFTLDIATGSQTDTQGLVINNIAGENQLATGLNIAGSVFLNNQGQSNDITQSWGATKDFTFVTIDTKTFAGVSAVAVNVLIPIQARADCSTVAGVVKCGVNKPGDQNLAVAATAVANAAPGGGVAGAIGILSKYADVIIETVAGDITVDENAVATLSIETASQTNLAALVLNNVVGMNQVATGVNIMGQQTQFSPFILFGATLASGTNQQFNTIHQCRGTPCDRPAAVTVVGP
jgi:hypothetical protein